MYAVVQELVFPFIKNLHGDKESAYAKYMGDAIFKSMQDKENRAFVPGFIP